MSDIIDLSGIELKGGGHDSRADGLCIMEAVAWVAGEPHTDRPKCACPALSAFARKLNDAGWPSDAALTKAMRPLIQLLVGSVASEIVLQRRGYFFADRAVREFAPLSLDQSASISDLSGDGASADAYRKLATRLREMNAITDAKSARDAYAAAAHAANAYYPANAYAADSACAAAAAYAADAAAAAYAADAAVRTGVLLRAVEILTAAARITE